MSKSTRSLALAFFSFALLVVGLCIVLGAAPEARATSLSTSWATVGAGPGGKNHFFANPEVIGVSPIPNTHTAPLTATESITYNQAISAATVSTRTFAVHAMQTGLLTETYGVNGATISLTPTQPFKPGELVQTSATTGTLYLDNTEPISPTVWQFWAAVGGGSGHFTDSGQRLGGSNSLAVALGDVDGDGGLDAFVGNSGGGANIVWRNQNLAISKSAPVTVVAGDVLTYTIVVTEIGRAQDATGVQVTDTVPVNTTCCASIGQGGSLVGDDVTWSGLTISASQSITLAFAVTVNQVPNCTIITNDAYRVVASTQGANTGLGSAVTTTVEWFSYILPVIMKNYP